VVAVVVLSILHSLVEGRRKKGSFTYFQKSQLKEPMPRVAVKDAEGKGGGRKRGGQPGSYLSFVAARAIVRKLKMKGREEWREWRKSGQRPSNIPSHPDLTYRDDGWISMPDWLGYEGQARGKMLSFTVARAIVRKLKLKGM
jgi:hypothetical protein